MGNKITAFLIILIVGSVMGFITENLFVAFRHGYIDNRGMVFPALIGYGMAILLIYFLIGTPQSIRADSHSRLIYIVMCASLASIGEIVLGNVIEKFCHMEWWNYESLPLHIGKYTSIPTSLGFGCMIAAFMDLFFDPIYAYVMHRGDLQLEGILLSIMCMMILDWVHAMYYMHKHNKSYIRWRYRFNNQDVFGTLLDKKAN